MPLKSARPKPAPYNFKIPKPAPQREQPHSPEPAPPKPTPEPPLAPVELSETDRQLALAEIRALGERVQKLYQETEMKHDELGELSAAEVEFIKQTRGKMGSKPEPTAEQLTAEKRARFQKLVGLSAGKWSARRSGLHERRVHEGPRGRAPAHLRRVIFSVRTWGLTGRRFPLPAPIFYPRGSHWRAKEESTSEHTGKPQV